MPTRWRLFQVLCIIQFLLACLLLFVFLYSIFVAFWLGGVVGTFTFAFIAVFAALGLELLRKNYPDKPVEGTQKKKFNRLFLLNFLLIAGIFGFIFYEVRRIRLTAQLNQMTAWTLPTVEYYMTMVYLLVLVFQFILLFGLYKIRRELWENANRKQFSFEDE